MAYENEHNSQGPQHDHAWHERDFRVEVPDVYKPALAVLYALRAVTLHPGDEATRAWLADPYNAFPSLEALKEQNPGRFFQLDQYLTIEFLLGRVLNGDSELIDESHPEYPHEQDFEQPEDGMLRLLSNEEFAQKVLDAVRNMKRLPSDSERQVFNAVQIINRAHEARAFALGVSAERFPALEYPVGHNSIPYLLSVAYSLKGCPARIFIHRALVNNDALGDLKGKSREAVDPVVDEPPTVPSYELSEEISEWAAHLKDDWRITEQPTVIRKKDPSIALDIETDVTGWPSLSIEYQFAHLARTKLYALLKLLMKILANIDKETLPPPVEGDGDFDPLKFSAEFFLAEYRLFSNMFSEVFDRAKALAESSPEEVHPDDQELVTWYYQLCETPEAAVIDPRGGFLRDLPGIQVDVPSDDLPDPFASDPLLTASFPEYIETPPQEYRIYVHPLIWKMIREQLGSSLTVSE